MKQESIIQSIAMPPAIVSAILEIGAPVHCSKLVRHIKVIANVDTLNRSLSFP